MNLLLVESEAKARTIQEYLGDDFLVRACRGHVWRLPEQGEEKGGNAYWASREGQLPDPPWRWTDGSEERMNEILEEVDEREIDTFYVATDPDREGEFIAWCLSEILEGHGTVRRITFQEITAEAVRDALEDPRPIDFDLVDSARVRKFLDRLVGFRGSRFAGSWFPDSTSMGRVQTPTLGFVVERELEREAFEPVPYFRVLADAEGVPYQVQFHDRDDPDAWVDDGSFRPDRTQDEQLTERALEALEAAGAVAVVEVERGSYQRTPKPPFTTESLLGAAGSVLGWNPGPTMAVAGDLYSAGHITYLRTDSTRTSEAARQQVREVIADRWGEDHLGPGAAEDATSDAPVQDAHEAVRPSRPDEKAPEDLEEDEERLYELIWARFAASQMSPARYEKATLTAEVGASGEKSEQEKGERPRFDRPLEGTVRWQVHAGWEAAYADLRSPRQTRPPTDALEPGAVHHLDSGDDDSENPRLLEEETQPPPRYRQHTLIRQMRKAGIGRPSTYATTVETLLERSYVEEEDRALVPTPKGRTLWTEVVSFYGPPGPEESLPSLPEGVAAEDLEVDVFFAEFTAEMESMLDGIEDGEEPAPAIWTSFRDRFRGMHNLALQRKRQRPTPKQLSLAERLLGALDEEEKNTLLEDYGVDQLSDLTGEQMGDLIDELQERTEGSGPPSRKQLEFLESLIDETGMSEEEAAGLVGAADFSELTGGGDGTASEVIEELKKRRPASDDQLEYIQDLADKADLDEAEVCALVGSDSYEELTGGRDGTASELLERLKEEAEA